MNTKKLILIVEDDHDLREVFKYFIEMDSLYETVAVEDGIKAYKWLSENKAPDLVLTDFYMYGRGDLLARSLVRLDIPVLILTSSPCEAIKALKDLNIKVPVVDKVCCVHTIVSLIDKMILPKK